MTNDYLDIYNKINKKVRIKVTDRCNLHCWFCHAEGTRNSNDLIINDNLSNVLDVIREVFQTAHITGGEPFMYRSLEELVHLLREKGYGVLLTSNGCFTLNQRILNIVERLDAINISFHSLDPTYYSYLSTLENVENIVKRIKDNIKVLSTILPTRINAVVSGDGKKQLLDDMVAFASEVGCELKLVPELRTRSVSIQAIEGLLSRNGFDLFQKIHIAPGSNVRDRYKDQAGNIIEVKKLLPYYPDFVCANCTELGKCDEGFSFFRLGGNPLYCQACIKHPPIPSEKFLLLHWDDLKSEYNTAK